MRIFVLLWCVAVAGLLPNRGEAQQSRRSRYVFEEQTRQVKKQRQTERKQVFKSVDAPSPNINVKAPEVEYDKDGSTLVTKGGVFLSYGGVQAQADRAKINTQTKDAELLGNVVVSNPQGTTSAESAQVNLDTETGSFRNAKFFMADGNFFVDSEEALKYSEFKYRLKNTSFTTCDCGDDTVPWKISTERANITKEGYAHTYWTSFRFYGVPLFYSPYFAFPVKTERASGLLVPDGGFSNRDGVRFNLPIFTVIDDSTDILFTPFIQTQTRMGTGIQFRRSFSLYNDLTTKLLYSDESARNGDQRGIQLFPGTPFNYDEQRLGVYHNHVWRSKPGTQFPAAFIADVHYVSDDYILREIPDDDIAIRTSRFTTSTALARLGLNNYGVAQVSGEYNQLIDGNLQGTDDAIFQRAPEADLNLIKTFRPFGSNPLGLKLVTRADASAIQFVRGQGYEGTRQNLNPTVMVPFHYKNYFNGSLLTGGYLTKYQTSNEQSAFTPEAQPLKKDPSRNVGFFQATLATAVEKTIDADPDGFLTTLASLGRANHKYELARVKHVIEPVVQYVGIGDTTQDNNPFFDSLDRVRERRTFTYGINNYIYGRFLPRASTTNPIAELTPHYEDLPTLDPYQALSSSSSSAALGADSSSSSVGSSSVSSRLGQIQELASFGLKQTYSERNRQNDQLVVKDRVSDVTGYFNLSPTQTFTLGGNLNWNPYRGAISSWQSRVIARDDRGDVVRFTYDYFYVAPEVTVDLADTNSLAPLQGDIEVVVTPRLRVGYYARFDTVASDFIEQAAAIRLTGGCNCWFFEVGMTDQVNPNRQSFNFRFTFAGLGDLAQNMLYRNSRQPMNQ